MSWRSTLAAGAILTGALLSAATSTAAKDKAKDGDSLPKKAFAKTLSGSKVTLPLLLLAPSTADAPTVSPPKQKKKED